MRRDEMESFGHPKALQQLNFFFSKWKRSLVGRHIYDITYMGVQGLQAQKHLTHSIPCELYIVDVTDRNMITFDPFRQKLLVYTVELLSQSSLFITYAFLLFL